MYDNTDPSTPDGIQNVNAGALNAIPRLLRAGLVPVVHGDVVLCHREHTVSPRPSTAARRRCTILSGDILALHLVWCALPVLSLLWHFLRLVGLLCDKIALHPLDNGAGEDPRALPEDSVSCFLDGSAWCSTICSDHKCGETPASHSIDRGRPSWEIHQ